MKTTSETITFRLNQELLRKLDKARDPFGDSRGQYVQRIIIAHLLRDRDEAFEAQLAELRQSLAKLEDEVDAQNQTVLQSFRRLAFLLLTSEETLSVEQAKPLVAKLTSRSSE